MTNAAPQWLQDSERGNKRALGWMRTFAEHAPGWVADPTLWLISFYYTLFPSEASAEGSAAYLRAVLGHRPKFAERHRHVRTFAHVIFDRVGLLGRGVAGFEIRPRNHEIISRYHAEGRACILLGAHFGSFEALRSFDRLLPGLSVRYLMFTENADKTSPILDSINPDIAAQIISLNDGQAAMLAVREALDEGHFVAFLGDRMPLRNPRAEIEVDFMGHPAIFPRAPYLIAILAEAPLILCFSPLVGKKTYDIVFSEIYDGTPVARGKRDDACRALAQRFADELANMCRSHPYNWFNFFDIWK